MSRLLALSVIALAAPSAAAQIGPGLDLSWNAITTGGGTSSGGPLTLLGAIGQPMIGAMSGAGFELTGGFIGGSSGPPPCYPDCNSDGSLNLADFGCFTTKFALADPYADCNGDGVRNLADFGCFTTKFALGCP